MTIVAAADNLIQETALLELNVTGMTCGHCVRAVTQAVRTVDPEAQVATYARR